MSFSLYFDSVLGAYLFGFVWASFFARRWTRRHYAPVLHYRGGRIDGILYYDIENGLWRGETENTGEVFRRKSDGITWLSHAVAGRK